MNQEHDLILTISQMNEILYEALKINENLKIITMKTKETLNKGIFNWLLKYFRPHIVEIDDYFYIRRFSILGRQYLGVSTLWWWSSSYKHYAEFSTLEKAEERFNNRKEIRKREKVIKIL